MKAKGAVGKRFSVKNKGGNLHEREWNSQKKSAKDYAKASDSLSRETLMMEERLAALRRAMEEEKRKRAMPVGRGGTRWGAARKVQGDYAKQVLDKINRKVAEQEKAKKEARRLRKFQRKASSGKLQNQPKVKKSESKIKKSAPAGKPQTQQHEDAKAHTDLGSSEKTSRPATRPGSSYAPPIKSSRISRMLVDLPGNVRKEMEMFTDDDIMLLTREDMMDICGKAQGIRLYRRIHQAVAPPSAAAATHRQRQLHQGLGRQRPKPERKTVRPPTQSTSLLDGNFDESEGHSEFLKAREEFLRGLANSGSKQTQIVREDGASVYQHSTRSLTKGEFDERAGHNAFLKARKQFLSNAGIYDATNDKPDEGFKLPSGQSTDMWKPAEGKGEDLGVMMTMLGIEERDGNQGGEDLVTSRIASPGVQENNEKASCYNCYRLFYKDKGITGKTGHLFCTEKCVKLDEAARGNRICHLAATVPRISKKEEQVDEEKEGEPHGKPVVELAVDDSDEDDEEVR
uniref:SAM domain-containing protein n=1 Tax=Lotharella globosa TaxID=91324 RepID=A0A7S4DNP6_9EUKA